MIIDESMAKKIIIFTWKMNPSSLKEAEGLFNFVLEERNKNKNENFEIVVAAPFVYLSQLSSLIHQGRVKLAAQDVFYENQGAYTGEISPIMLKNLGVEYVIIGHSERRNYLNEKDEMINKKVKAALEAGLKVVLCVGELERESGVEEAKNYVNTQLEKDFNDISSMKYEVSKNLIVAYEPVWAISTTKNARICSPEEALEMIKFIKQTLNSKFHIPNSRVVYGGSVDGKNIESFIKYQDVDGALVGGASLKTEEVEKIIKLLT